MTTGYIFQHVDAFAATPFVGGIRRLIIVLEIALEVRRERRMLLQMDDRALKDIGVNRCRACAEAGRSFWDIPVDRLRP